MRSDEMAHNTLDGEIVSIDKFLQRQLVIPNYQRPYKWRSKNIIDLLEDISEAINNSKIYTNFKYRVGTVIIHKDEKGKLNIIDGQQRIVSLTLLKKYLDKNCSCSLMEKQWEDRVSQINIRNNFNCIKNWFALKDQSVLSSFKNALENVIEFVVLTVNNLGQAFQLFDSQNTRGKALDPHDLLKAYHLREMKNEPLEMRHAVSKWESFSPQAINKLFDVYLYPILKWMRKEKATSFTADKIDCYKGISADSHYTYAQKARHSEPFFQIADPFISGKDFFEMVDHYLTLLNDIEYELSENPKFETIKKIISLNKTVGFNYSVDLFKCVLLCFYDKFHVFDLQAINKLCVWAFMIRVDMRYLGFDTINKYAIGEQNERYTNLKPMFALINQSRFHSDIGNLLILTDSKNKNDNKAYIKDLHDLLKKINGGF